MTEVLIALGLLFGWVVLVESISMWRMWRWHRRLRRNRDDLHHVTGAYPWWGRR